MKRFFDRFFSFVFSSNLLVFGLFIGWIVSRAVLGDDLTDPLPDTAFWTELLHFLQGVKGASVLGVAAMLTQLVMVFLRTNYASIVGEYRLAALFTVNVVFTLVGHLMSGLDLLPALLHSTVISAVMVAVNEWMKHRRESKERAMQVPGR